MFVRQKESLLGMSYAEIQRVVYAVINKYYDKEGFIKLTDADKVELVWTIITHIYEQSAKFDPAKGKVIPWIWKLAKNKFIGYMEAETDFYKNHVFIGRSNSPLSETIKKVEDTFTNLTKAEMDAFETEVKLLDPDDQQILSLYINKVSEKEIAQKLGMNYNTVRQKIRRLKAHLAYSVRHRLSCSPDLDFSWEDVSAAA